MNFRTKHNKRIGVSGRIEGAGVENSSLGVYERLLLLNQHFSAIVDILKLLSKKGFISKRECTYYRLMVEEVRASSSQCIVESLDRQEVQVAGVVSRKRFELERKLFCDDKK